MNSAIISPHVSPKILATNNLSDGTTSNSALSSIFAITSSVATPANHYAPDTAQPMIVHRSIAHPLIVLPMMALQKMVQPGATSDCAAFDGAICNGNAHHGTAYHGIT